MGRLEVTEKPTTPEQYEKWLRIQHGVEISKITRTHYTLTTTKVKDDLENSIFWNRLKDALKLARDEYLVGTGGYNLFQTADPPEILIKPFDSLLDKSFRINVLRNRQWPNQPDNGWILPSNWLAQINDILRTSLVVKYMDGVEFLVGKMQCLCEDTNLRCDISYEAREEGYYAAHVYIRHGFEIADVNLETARTDMKIEFQLTTQLQELIRTLAHRYYEATRSKPKQEEIKWQWNFRSEEFVPYYLGHILHYIEGMIMEIREGQRRARS